MPVSLFAAHRGSDRQFNWTGMGYTVPQHIYCRVDKRTVADIAATLYSRH